MSIFSINNVVFFSNFKYGFIWVQIFCSRGNRLGFYRSGAGFGMLDWNWIFSQVFGLTTSLHNNTRLHVVLNGTCLQECPVNAGFLQGSSIGPTFFLLYINDLPDGVISNIATYADDGMLIKSGMLPDPNLTYEILWTGVGYHFSAFHCQY